MYFNVNFNVFFKLIKVRLLVSDLYVAEKIKEHVLCSINSFSEGRALYEIVWQNSVEPDWPQMT